MLKCKILRSFLPQPHEDIQSAPPNHRAPFSHIHFGRVRRLAAQPAQISTFVLVNGMKQIANRPNTKFTFTILLIEMQGMNFINSNIDINNWPPGTVCLQDTS